MTQQHEITNRTGVIPRQSRGSDQALAVLRAGGVIALPTDTLYGLGASVFNESALQKVFAVKGRPAGMALPVLVNGWDMVERVAGGVPEIARRLAERFWPGPLTLVVPSAAGLSPLITGGGATVGVRSPDHWVPQELINRLGEPITGTSANRSGGPDLTSLAELRQELGQSVDYIVEAGPAPLGTASTVIDVTGDTPRLLREGAIGFDQVLRIVENFS